jgi:prepilin-type N-terminal cleavage/methylation domain-containing protein
MSFTKSKFRRSLQGNTRNRKVSGIIQTGVSARSAVRKAFSLVEMLAVLAVVTVITGLSVPALNGVNGGNTLNTATVKLADLMTVARSEAISRNTIVRFVITRDWTNKPGANLRRVSLWGWDGEIERYVALTPWEDLPDGIVVEPEVPSYVGASNYARDDRASVRGDCVLDSNFQGSASFNPGTAEEPVDARFIEFTPAGNVRIPGGDARNVIFVATNGFASEDGTLRYARTVHNAPATWSQLNVDTLTGRVRIYRP